MLHLHVMIANWNYDLHADVPAREKARMQWCFQDQSEVVKWRRRPFSISKRSPDEKLSYRRESSW